MLLITEKHMIEQGTITREEAACYFEGFCVPMFRFLGPKCDIKATWNLIDLFLQLNDESDLSRYAEVGNYVKADSFKEGVSRYLLLISSVHCQVFSLNGSDLHDVSNVQ